MDIREWFGWRPAIDAWRRGDPARAVELINRGTPIPDELRAVVAELVEHPPPRPPGRPSPLRRHAPMVRVWHFVLTEAFDPPMTSTAAKRWLARHYGTTVANVEDALAARGTHARHRPEIPR